MLDLFALYSGTILLGVPTMLGRMLDEQDRQPRMLGACRLITLGGAPVAPELIHRAATLIGAKVAIGYGQTETSPYLTHTYPDDPHPDWQRTVGASLPHTAIRIADVATDDTLPVGSLGEIRVKGYGVMTGHHDDPSSTDEAFDALQWLRTGDIGSIDDKGYLRIQGRLRDLIIRGGENIYPREIEDVLFTHADVANVAVLGLRDPEWGEKVVACVQLRLGCSVDDGELTALCNSALASYKIPREWHFMDTLPQTASGKIQKFRLREMFDAQPGPPV